MRVFAQALTLLSFCSVAGYAQNPVCPSPYVYMDGGNFIKVFNPAQPPSATNPSNTSIPTLGNGLALMPNLNGGTVCPTFYTTSNGNYHYWNGSSWVNTGHSTGNSAAVNVGGCGSYVYNLVGSTGDVYVYDGTGNGTLLTTLPGFAGGNGPFDLTTDCNCNFYAINTSTIGSGQSLTQYNPGGAVTATYALVNMPHATAGGGFGIVGNMVYLKNNLTNGFFVGTIAGSSVTFTQVMGFTASPGDFASCPTCTSVPPSLSAQMTGALLSCYNPTANLIVTTTASPVSYSWSGPGITGPATNSVVAINAAGSYSCLVTYLGCPNAQVRVSTNVLSMVSPVTAAITPSGNICAPAGKLHKLAVAHTSTAETVTWSGPGISGNSSSDTLVVAGAGTYSVKVVNPVNGCAASDAMSIIDNPTVSVSLSSTSMCALPLFGSPASITVSASGAASYTYYPDPSISIAPPNSATAVVTAVFNGFTGATATVVGSNAFCRDTAQVNLTIYANPTLALGSASICPGEQHTFTASGAGTYTWGGVNLDTFSGPVVVASPTSNATYSVIAGSGQCRSPITFAHIGIKPIPTVSVSPTFSTICLGSAVTFTAGGSAASFTWKPSNGLGVNTGSSISAMPPASQVYTVTGSLNGCTASATSTVTVQVPPVLSLNLSATAMCFNAFNGSPNSITATPSGATSYTLLQGTSYAVNNPAGPQMLISPAGPVPTAVTLATATLIGTQGVCTVIKTQTFEIIPNPVIQITPPTSYICPGEAAIISASGADTYTWLPAPGLFTYQPHSIIVKPIVNSHFPVIGSSLGCRSDTKNGVVVVKPVPSLSVVPASQTVCAGNSVALIAKGNAESYSWEPSATLSSATGATVIATPMVNTTFVVTGVLNSCTNVAVGSVSSIPIPTIAAMAQQSVVCSGSRTGLSAAGAHSFSWFPAIEVQPAIGPSVSVNPYASQTFTVWGYNGVCSGSASVLVRTIRQPDIRINTEDGQNTICSGRSLPVTLSGAEQYSWMPPHLVTAVSTTSMVLLQPQVSTNFTVIGITSDGTVTCPQLISFSVPVVPIAQARVTGDQRLCAGEKVTLEAKGGNTFSWSPSRGLNADALSRVVASPESTTIYTVHVSYDQYCGSTATVMVQVDPRPYVSAGRDTSWHVNDVITLEATGTGEISWISGEGIACSHCAFTQVYPSRSGCYVASARNEFGCETIDEVCLEISEDFYLYIPNSFTPNNDGLNDVFEVYGENVLDLELSVYDRWGQLVFAGGGSSGGWDGTIRGVKCKADTYVWKLSYKGLDRKTYNRSGHVTIVR